VQKVLLFTMALPIPAKMWNMPEKAARKRDGRKAGMSSIARGGSETSARAPEGGWTALIADIAEGRWISPLTGEPAPRSATDRIVIAESLNGTEADLVAGLGVDGPIAVVADADTWDAMGARIHAALDAAGRAPRAVVLEAHPHADLATAEALAARLEGVAHVVAVGSGTVNDLCKYVTHADGRACSVFGTAASMDGYASSTASMGLPSGLKVSLKAHAPKGVFLDLSVIAAAPPRMAASGFGDCLCSSVARIDWWMSHRLLGTFFREEPYLIAEAAGEEMNARAAGIGRGETEAIGHLVRALILSGLGISFTNVSNHGSMGEHQISHYIDCFAEEKHPGTLHGQQVGVASLTMARIQTWFLDQARPPVIRPTRIDEADMARRMGPAIGAECAAEYRKKALDADGAARLNEALQEIWPTLRAECAQWIVPVETMKDRLAAAGGPTSAADLGLPVDFYREAVRHAHEMRNRFSFADLACDAGLLDDFAAEEG
jgi:glycerol-1-phosphate dehydrogenase [NAD(P)+]